MLKKILKSVLHVLAPVSVVLLVGSLTALAATTSGRPVTDPLLVNTIGSSAAGFGGVTLVSDVASHISLNPGGTLAFRCNPITTRCSTFNNFVLHADEGFDVGNTTTGLPLESLGVKQYLLGYVGNIGANTCAVETALTWSGALVTEHFCDVNVNHGGNFSFSRCRVSADNTVSIGGCCLQAVDCPATGTYSWQVELKSGG